MDYSIIYIFSIYIAYTILMSLLFHRTFSRNTTATRTLITLFNIAACVDVCLYLNNAGTYFITVSDFLQQFMKDSLGLLFLYRSIYFDYGLILFIIFTICMISNSIEIRLRSSKRPTTLHIHGFSISHPRKPSINILSAINTICAIIATIVTLIKFILNVIK